MADKKHNLWFSKKQRKALNSNHVENFFGLLENGEIVEYTEITLVGTKPFFEDAVLLGVGEFDHSER